MTIAQARHSSTWLWIVMNSAAQRKFVRYSEFRIIAKPDKPDKRDRQYEG